MKKELNEYLQDPFNYEVYECLALDKNINIDWLSVEIENNGGLFEPIEFFELLYSELDKIKNNTNPNLIEFTNDLIDGYKGFNIEQKLFFIHYLTYKINLEHPEHGSDTKQLKINKVFNYLCSWANNISDMYESKSEPQPEKENKYDFQKVKHHIETLATVKDKILYLTEIKTDFLQNESYLDYDLGTPFDHKCELEIKKLNEALKLEAYTTTPKTKPRLGEYSNSQLVLIFYYFFTYSGIEPRVNTDIAPIAKFLHLITGKEFSNTQSSDFYKKLLKAPNHIGDKNLIDDLNHIKPLFQKVELNEIVKMIDNEIDQCRTEIKETKTGKR